VIFWHKNRSVAVDEQFSVKISHGQSPKAILLECSTEEWTAGLLQNTKFRTSLHVYSRIPPKKQSNSKTYTLMSPATC